MGLLNKGYSDTKIYALILKRLFVWLFVTAIIIGMYYGIYDSSNNFPTAFIKQKFQYDVLASEGAVRTKTFKISRKKHYYNIMLRDNTPRLRENSYTVNVKVLNKQNQVINEYNQPMNKYDEEPENDSWYRQTFKTSKDQELYLALAITNARVLQTNEKHSVELIIDQNSNQVVANYFHKILVISFIGMIIMLIVPRYMN